MRNRIASFVVAAVALGGSVAGVAGAAPGGDENLWPHITCYNEGRVIGAGGFAAGGGLTYELWVSADYGDESRKQVIPPDTAPLKVPLRLEIAAGASVGDAVLTSAPTNHPDRKTELDRKHYRVPCASS